MLYDNLVTHLASGPSARVVVTTWTRQTIYTPKHLALFSAPTRFSETGVYIRRGRTAKDYVFPQYLKFARVQTLTTTEERIAS